MIDLQPNLASYARVSYFRELHGDLAGATPCDAPVVPSALDLELLPPPAGVV